LTTYWAPLLHTYQPTFQDPKILRVINKECYKPLFSMLQEHENSAFSVNLNANLIDMLQEYNLSETLDIVNDLRSRGKIEIVGAAKYHPILPLISQKEAKRQILLNQETHIRVFDNWNPNGFFPPELSVNSNILPLIYELGYKWVLLSGVACPLTWPYNQIYLSSQGLKLYFRDDILSNKISFNNISAKQFVDDLKEMFNDHNEIKNNDKYVITAMDSETFGHHHKNYERLFLSKTLELINDEEDIELIFISNLDKIFPKCDNPILPQASSWSTTEEDLKENIPYPLWNHPNNNIHQLFWKMIKSTERLIELTLNLPQSNKPIIEEYKNTARWFYDQCVCSDTTWWANAEREIWSPNLIYNGIELIMKVAINAQLALIYAGEHELGENYYNSINTYHGFLVMELNTISQKLQGSSTKKKKKKS